MFVNVKKESFWGLGFMGTGFGGLGFRGSGLGFRVNKPLGVYWHYIGIAELVQLSCCVFEALIASKQICRQECSD